MKTKDRWTDVFIAFVEIDIHVESILIKLHLKGVSYVNPGFIYIQGYDM